MAKDTSYEAIHYAAFSIPLSLHLSLAQIFSSTSCSQIALVYVLPVMSETKFHNLRKPEVKLIVLHIPIFMFLDSRQEDKRLRAKWQQALPKFKLLLPSSGIKFWSVTVVPKYMNCATFSKVILAILML
jgi:hypothetical protein